jgi:hypothetical protein
MINLYQGAERPSTVLTMTDNGVNLNLGAGEYTFQVKVVSVRDERKQITKTTNIFGYNNATPNIKIEWQPTNELSTLPPGWYSFQCKATAVRDSTEYYYRTSLLIRPSL